MKIIKDVENIKDEDKIHAFHVLNKLKIGCRTFGSPAEGLKKTLKNIEKEHEEKLKKKDVLQYLDNDEEYISQRNKLRAGIKGEETLSEYFEKIIKYDKELQDIILFASLSDPNQIKVSDDYISDSDFIAIYGNDILILDAKNIVTSPELPIYLDGNNLVTVGGALLLELHPSTFIWKNIFLNNNVEYNSIHGCTVIVNNKGACVWKNQDWKSSEVKPIHISDLVNFLHDWIKNKQPNVNLSLLTTLVKMQIKKEETDSKIRNKMRRFGI